MIHTQVAGLGAHLLVVSVQQIELNQTSLIPRKQGGDSIRIRERDVARSSLVGGGDSGGAGSGTKVAGAAFLQSKCRYDIGDVSEFRRGLTNSQAARNTKVAHFSSPSNEPRRGSDRRDRPSLLDNTNVDVVPAIVNGGSWDSIGVYSGDADECERKSQREESDHGGHFSLQSEPMGCEIEGYGDDSCG